MKEIIHTKDDEAMLDIILLLVGFGFLIKGAGFFVDGASAVAKLLNVSPMLIGLTIVAFGTSAPEATVSVTAALNGNADMALGNVVGSNIFNITFIVGLTAIIAPLTVDNQTIRKEIPFTLLAGGALLIMISDTVLQSAAYNELSRSEGLILLLFFTVFLYYIFEVARKNRDVAMSELPEPEKQVHRESSSYLKYAIITVVGLAGIIFGGHLVVVSSSAIASALGMSETLVGLTIVAVGTSLPELATSMIAVLKKQTDIALGNIVGSNIFNILFVLGISSFIVPLRVDPKLFVDVFFMLLLTVILLIFSRSRYTISRYEGIFLAVVYLSYLVFIIMRN